MELANQIRNYMGAAGMTIHSLSEQSGLSEDTVKAILYQRVNDVKLSTAVKLANAFCCSMDDLIGRTW